MNFDKVIGCVFYGAFQSCEDCGLVKGSKDCDLFQLIPTVKRVFNGDVNE